MKRDVFTDSILVKAFPEGLFTDNPIPQAFWPRCARCQRPVDRVVTKREESRRVTVLTAHCHGETESSEMPDTTLLRGRVLEAVAFEGHTPPFRPGGTDQPAKPDSIRTRASLSSPPAKEGTFVSPPPRSSPPFSEVAAEPVKHLCLEPLHDHLEEVEEKLELSGLAPGFRATLVMRRRGG